jgi:hypothetical protein
MTPWVEDGIQYRLNTIAWGGKIILHAHHWDHTSEVKNGRFNLVMYSPTGERSEVTAEKGWKELIPAYWKHTFKPLPVPANEKQVWEVLCSWPEGAEQERK